MGGTTDTGGDTRTGDGVPPGWALALARRRLAHATCARGEKGGREREADRPEVWSADEAPTDDADKDTGDVCRRARR